MRSMAAARVANAAVRRGNRRRGVTMEPAIAAAGMKRTPTRRLLASAGCSRIRMMRTQERRGREKDVHVSLQRDTRGERRARKSKREDLRERLDHPVRPRDRASDSMPLQAAATLTFKCAMRAAGSARRPAARHERRAARARDRGEKTFVNVSIIPFARATTQATACLCRLQPH
jgi:hypothetical protein